MDYQERTKKAKVKKRGAHKFPTPKEIKITSQIMCISCKGESGFENEDFINIKPPRDIKCKNCGKICVKLRNSFDSE